MNMKELAGHKKRVAPLVGELDHLVGHGRTFERVATVSSIFFMLRPEQHVKPRIRGAEETSISHVRVEV